jgi:chromosome segregation ATPase
MKRTDHRSRPFYLVTGALALFAVLQFSAQPVQAHKGQYLELKLKIQEVKIHLNKWKQVDWKQMEREMRGLRADLKRSRKDIDSLKKQLRANSVKITRNRSDIGKLQRKGSGH